MSGVTIRMLCCAAVLAFCGSGFVAYAAAGDDLRLVDAVKSRDARAIKTLLPVVDVNAAQPDGATALHWAAHWNDLETVQALIRAKANVNAANDLGVTPLLVASADAGPA